MSSVTAGLTSGRIRLGESRGHLLHGSSKVGVGHRVVLVVKELDVFARRVDVYEAAIEEQQS